MGLEVSRIPKFSSQTRTFCTKVSKVEEMLSKISSVSLALMPGVQSVHVGCSGNNVSLEQSFEPKYILFYATYAGYD
jgi:hypothetical protein